MIEPLPGLVVLLSSGETSPNGRRVFEWLFRQLPGVPQMALMETPAGFQPNSSTVADRVAQYIRDHLPAYRPAISLVPARARGSAFSPDDASIVAPLLDANIVYLGAGSPTYAVRQLRDSLAWQTILARHRLGTALILASAAAIAVSELSLPVYEIFKVGDDLHWLPGLDLFGAYGLRLAIVSHWDNNDGGTELDTSRGFLGHERFQILRSMLPDEITAVGLDEQTALIVDLAARECRVLGKGGICVCRRGVERRFEHGHTLGLDELGTVRMPDPREGIPSEVWNACLRQPAGAATKEVDKPPEDVVALLREREDARSRRNFAESDRLRRQLAALGWEVRDTPQGQQLRPLTRESE